MSLPVNFLYLGGDKCGSTWIHHILSQHPDVALARAKELFYFDRFYSKGPDWYLRQFPAPNAALRLGEVCHDYLYSRIALERIAHDLPRDARFLITVRDPVARTLSHYRYLQKIGRTSLSLETALQDLPQLVEHSSFGKHVAQAQDILGAQRVHVLPFEKLARDPTGFGRDLSDALDIPFVPALPYAQKVLEAQDARHPAMVRVLRNIGWGLRRAGAPRIVGAVKSNKMVQQVLFRNGPPGKQPALSPDVQNRLLDRFAPDQELLRQRVPNLMVTP